MAIEWKDISHRTRAQRPEELGRTFEAKVGSFTLTVTRHLHLEDDQWMSYIDQTKRTVPARGLTTEQAQAWVVEELRRKCKTTLAAISET